MIVNNNLSATTISLKGVSQGNTSFGIPPKCVLVFGIIIHDHFQIKEHVSMNWYWPDPHVHNPRRIPCSSSSQMSNLEMLIS